MSWKGNAAAKAPKQKETKAQTASAHAATKKAQEAAGGMIAVIRIRGTAGVSGKIEQTLGMLRLHKSNHMAIVMNNMSMRKMVDKVKDFVAYGDISEQTLEAALEKRGLIEGNKRITPEFLKEKKFSGFDELAKAIYSGKNKLKELGLEPLFRLNPPKKGHERGGIKKPYRQGGALGNRGKEINELIMRMI
ncbi:MAG TPA: 50S ribosomal protein L30 [archaeon]|nr:50S ribosomal protein L30 [archaeon]